MDFCSKEALHILMMSVVLFMTFSGASSSTEGGSKVHVVVENALGIAPLLVHCKSEKSDLGTQTLMFASKGSLSFRTNVVGSNRVSCSFAWGSQFRDFDIFVYERDYLVCRSTCVWKIFTYGPCRTKSNASDIDVCFKWY